GETPIIALPGNPISTLVSLRMLVLPALWTAFAAGAEPTAIQVKIHDAVTGIRHKTQYRRAVVGTQGFELVATLQGEAGSHLLAQARAEEHTSELQSRFDLVCRLLLEKKNSQRV